MDIKNGVCPKCGSNLIYSNLRKKKYSYGSAILLKVTWWYKWASLCHYVRASCGYTEAYVANPDSMKRILEEFEPVNKSKRKNEE